MGKVIEKFYIDESTGMLYIKEQTLKGHTWGWYKYYDNEFRMCMPKERAKTFKPLTEKEFRKLYFLEKI